jgi:hypothetical protein
MLPGRRSVSGDAHGDPAVGAHLVCRVMRTVAKRLLLISVCCRIDLAAVVALALLPGEALLDEVGFTDVSPLMSVLPKIAVGPGTTV